MNADSVDGVPLSGTSTSIELVGGETAPGSVGDAIPLSVVAGDDSLVDDEFPPPHETRRTMTDKQEKTTRRLMASG